MKFSKYSYIMMFVVFSINFFPGLCFTTFVFGDSLVDAGNNDYIFTLSKADSPPYGIDFKPSGGRPTGRFTNGRTISDIIGEYLGAESFPPPFLAPNTEADTIYTGINYASGAAGILDETGFLFLGRIPLREQVKHFEESRDYIVKVKGENETMKLLKEAIFSLTFGSNDIINYFQPSIPFFQSNKVAPSDYLDHMISNLTIHLKELHDLGARKFVVVGVGPLGCIPFVRAVQFVRGEKCSEEVNEVIEAYNVRLSGLVGELNQEFGPKTMFVYANSYAVFMKIIVNYQQYGFVNAKQPCCGAYFPPFICYNKGQSQDQNRSSSSFLCDDRSKYVFWDAYHPTEAANIIIAKELLDGDETISAPINIRQLHAYRF
ncbi:GDSL esterase/lipase At5g41890 [Cucurbita maxima]|uniref:GDSL esterase/lipase At5g41890 n=1 Tax=Cucurbita maxima TaxID=3661 RepID=A0A6J1IR23_CUCMA|nr:GDSL esterase/lipase At5g41890 [Cucurbita maxima]